MYLNSGIKGAECVQSYTVVKRNIHMEGLLRTQCLQETSQEPASNGAECWGLEGDFYTSGFGTCDFKGLEVSLLKAA